MTLRVLVVDDHPAFRRALTSALNMVDNIEVAGEADGGVRATEQVAAVEPDLVIMDLSMPDISGIDAMKAIHRRQPDLPVVFLTAHADPGGGSETGSSTGLRDLWKGVAALRAACTGSNVSRGSTRAAPLGVGRQLDGTTFGVLRQLDGTAAAPGR